MLAPSAGYEHATRNHGAAARRPPTITPERLADIGIRLGLPNLTMANVAAELAVTQAALYSAWLTWRR